jgi:hypothetical protein
MKVLCFYGDDEHDIESFERELSDNKTEKINKYIAELENLPPNESVPEIDIIYDITNHSYHTGKLKLLKFGEVDKAFIQFIRDYLDYIYTKTEFAFYMVEE